METQGSDVNPKPTETEPPVWPRRPVLWLVVVLLGLAAGAVTFYNWRTIARFCQTPAACLNIADFGVNTQRSIFFEKTDARIRTFLIPPRTKQILNDVQVNRKIENTPALALSLIGPALDALFYLQKSEGTAIKSESLQELFRNRNAVALLELLVPAGGALASDPQRIRNRIECFETARRLLETPDIDENDRLNTVLTHKSLLTGGLEPIFTVILTNEGHRPVSLEEVAVVVDRAVRRSAHLPQEPIPLPDVLDIRLGANSGSYRHRLAVPLQIAAKSQTVISIRFIREEDIESRYEMKCAFRGAGFELFTDSFILRM